MHSLLFPLFFLLVRASLITFDLSQEINCLAANGGCSFDNSSIWTNNIVPSSDDDVLIAGNGGYLSELLLIIPGFLNITVRSCNITTASLTLDTNSTFMVQFLNVGNNAAFSILEGATLSSPSTNTDSNFNLLPIGQLLVHGSIYWYGNATLQGQINVFDKLEDIVFNSVDYLPVTANIGRFMTVANINILTTYAYFPYGLAIINRLTVSSNCTMEVGVDLELQELTLESGSVLKLNDVNGLISSPYAIAGFGNISINNSQITIRNRYHTSSFNTTFNGTICVTGQSTVIFQNFVVGNLNLSPNENDNVTILSQGLTVSGVTVGYGSLDVSGDEGLSVSGLVHIFGLINVNQSVISVIPNGTLNVTGFPLNLINSNISLGGNITGDVIVPIASALNITTVNATIVGNVLNDGSLHVDETNTLLIYGNFQQTSNGVTYVTLMNNGQPALNVTNGSISLAGTIMYKLTKKPFLHNAKFPVLAGINSQIEGSFNGSAAPLSSSVLHRDLKLEYTTDIVYAVYDFNVQDVARWEWVIAGVVPGVIVLAAIACIIKFRTNRNYQRIPD